MKSFQRDSWRRIGSVGDLRLACSALRAVVTFQTVIVRIADDEIPNQQVQSTLFDGLAEKLLDIELRFRTANCLVPALKGLW